MKRYMVLFLIVLLAACGANKEEEKVATSENGAQVEVSGEVTSLKGTLQLFREDRYVVECTDQVVMPDGPQQTIGYLCEILLTGDTVIRTDDGARMDVSVLKEEPAVTILIEPTILGQDQETRKVQAKEIIVER